MEGPSSPKTPTEIIKETTERHFSGLIDDVKIRVMPSHRVDTEMREEGMYEGFKPIYVADIGLSKEEQFCLIIELSYDKENKYMCFVSQLGECGTDKNPKNTRNIMNTLKHMLKEMDKEGKARIGLTDVSHKKICGKHIPLSVYYILRTGQSWYNSLGFVSDNIEQEKKHNEQIRKKTLGDYKENKHLKGVDIVFWKKYENMTLADFATEIWDGTTNKCEHIDVLHDLCIIVRDELLYDNSLEYDEKYDGSEIIKRHFSGLVQNVNLYKDPSRPDRYFFNVQLSNNGEPYNKRCINMKIYDDEEGKRICYVDDLDACKTPGYPTETKAIMNALKNMAKEMDIASIGITDASKKRMCDKSIPLPVYYILRTGISWYNSLGFVSKNIEKEKEHNEIIRKKTLGDYKEELKERSDYEYNWKKQNYPDENREEETRFREKMHSDDDEKDRGMDTDIELSNPNDVVLPDGAVFDGSRPHENFWKKYENMTLADFATEIWDGTTNKCEHIDVLYHICIIVRDELLYDTSLEYDEKYDVKKTRGGRSTKKRHMKRRSTKKRLTKKRLTKKRLTKKRLTRRRSTKN